jgi:SAM-dependent methyltransferase
MVEGPARLPPGRALDLGCGTGTSSIYLARHGWEVTGVDFVGGAIATARHRAEAAGVALRLVVGDVTRLEELGIGEGYTLLVDFGCYHGVPSGRRDAYAASVTRVAAPGAPLLMLAMGKAGPVGVTADELRGRFAGWELAGATRIPDDEFWPRFSNSKLARLLARTPLEVWRFQLERKALGQAGS